MTQEQLSDAVAFDVAGERKTLRMTPTAFIELEDAGLGHMNSIGGTLQQNPSFKTFLKVFAAGLRGGTDPEMSDATAREIADKIGSEKTIELVGKAIVAAFPATKANMGNVAAPD